jgi:DNA repair protein RadC
MSNHLFTSDADGVTRPATADEILDAARAMLARRVRKGNALSNPRATRDFLRLQPATRDHEVFAILFLDNRHRVIESFRSFAAPSTARPFTPGRWRKKRSPATPPR